LYIHNFVVVVVVFDIESIVNVPFIFFVVVVVVQIVVEMQLNFVSFCSNCPCRLGEMKVVADLAVDGLGEKSECQCQGREELFLVTFLKSNV
jgi:hypothetical protein